MPKKRNDKSKIGTILYLNRTAAGLTQEETAKMIGKTKGMVSKYEKGLNMPGGQMIIRLAKAYGIKAHDMAYQIYKILEEEE